MSKDLEKITLSETAAKIWNLHEGAMLAVKTTLSNAIEIGKLLIDIKEEIPHGAFGKYVEANLPFSVRTAQNYMRVYLNKDEVKKVEDISSAYALIENKRVKPVEPEQQEEQQEEPESDTVEYPFPKPDIDQNNYLYWHDVEIAVQALDRAYEKLSAGRDHTTPIALGHFIGNLKDIANRLKTWNPKNLMACPECNGSGLTKDGPCTNCIGGYIGIYKTSSN